MKACDNRRIVSAALIVAVGVNSDGRSKVPGIDIGPSEAETFWSELFHASSRRLAEDFAGCALARPLGGVSIHRT